MESEAKRDRRVTVSLTDDAYDNVKQIARQSGISPAAWMAMVVTQNSQQVLDTQRILLEAAREQVRATFGKQETIDALLVAVQEMDGENAT